ncbi:MAG: Txe/YoeB family addiction module toxin [Lachnospiraceae bacterium]|nr:Txe/YoeB family addiction module toxin [Lachnospiraceae bacterium]
MLKGAGLDSKAKNRLNIIAQNPFQTPPPYEGLVGNLNGYYSRRINIQHRMVYQVYNESVVIAGIVYEGTIKIVRMWSHYDSVK